MHSLFLVRSHCQVILTVLCHALFCYQRVMIPSLLLCTPCFSLIHSPIVCSDHLFLILLIPFVLTHIRAILVLFTMSIILLSFQSSSKMSVLHILFLSFIYDRHPLNLETSLGFQYFPLHTAFHLQSTLILPLYSLTLFSTTRDFSPNIFGTLCHSSITIMPPPYFITQMYILNEQVTDSHNRYNWIIYNFFYI